MVFRKLPGVSASGMGLRLSQKFVFLLFLSGLVTLCFGALFFLPDSVRLKRMFLSKTETQPVTAAGSENDADREHPRQRAAKDPDYLHRGGMTSSASASSSASSASAKLKPLLSRISSSSPVTRGAGAEERPIGAGGAVTGAVPELTVSRSRTESAAPGTETQTERSTSADSDASRRPADAFNYAAFRKCQLKDPLGGTDLGKPGDPQTAERRDKVREVGGGGGGGDLGALHWML